MRALVTFATPELAELQAISLPLMRSYAERHGYEVVVCDGIPRQRPASWYKVAALLGVLEDHEEALWLDADVVICDESRDIADEVADDSWQALAVHHTGDGEVPNCGVWLAREALRGTLERVWGMTQYLHHPWWEQGSVLELLGYDSWARPTVFHGPTDLHARTTFLGTEWNSHPWDEHPSPRFRHATMYGSVAERAAVMRGWRDSAD